MFKPVIFREYDIRGVVDHDYDEAFAYQLGRTFIHFNESKIGKLDRAPKIAVGRDARTSSVGLQRRLMEGMRDSGAQVIDLGLVTSPICYFSIFNLDLDGGVMVTGSHNPPEYNGFKISCGKSTIYGEDILSHHSLLEVANNLPQKPGGSIESYDILPAYVARYGDEFKHIKPLKVVLDCGNGAAGCVARRLFEACGLTPIILFEEPDGRFPNHHPDPTVEKNLVDLKKAIQAHSADLGIGLDGDADRIVIVDENGKTIMGDEFMILVSRDILSRTPGAKIVGDVKCSDRLYEDVNQHGGVGVMWKTGHSLIKSKIKELSSPFGGELSGHIFFNDRNYGYDDALYAGLRVLEIMSKTGKKVSQLLADLPPVFNTPEIRVDTTEEKKVLIVEALIQKFTQQSKTSDFKVNLIDGIRVSYADGWGLARASNTQPVLVLRFESNTAHGLARIQEEFLNVVNPLLNF
jgi:phosphomannomutase